MTIETLSPASAAIETLCPSSAPPVNYYYDRYPMEDDLMGDTAWHTWLVAYLRSVLNWYARDKKWFIAENFNIYRSADPNERPICPDVAVFKGVQVSDLPEHYLNSWRINPPNYPAPTVVFEIASEGTYRIDIRAKPARYNRLGVKEYFYYDPRPRASRRRPRLRGWRYLGGRAETMDADSLGRLVSDELDSILAPDDQLVRLYDRQGNMRLSSEEAALEEARAARLVADQERSAREAMQRKLEVALEALRKLGVNL